MTMPDPRAGLWPSRWRMFRDAYAIYRREKVRGAFLLAVGFARGGPR